MNKPKYIFVTGGVVSGLGKGITAASLGRLLKSRGLKVTAQKLDPYLNVDPGTMNPVQHGEVFVTDDGAETDLDLGHYERFTGIKTTRHNNFLHYINRNFPQTTIKRYELCGRCKKMMQSILFSQFINHYFYFTIIVIMLSNFSRNF